MQDKRDWFANKLKELADEQGMLIDAGWRDVENREACELTIKGHGTTKTFAVEDSALMIRSKGELEEHIDSIVRGLFLADC